MEIAAAIDVPLCLFDKTLIFFVPIKATPARLGVENLPIGRRQCLAIRAVHQTKP
jgi:hypothetical protein